MVNICEENIRLLLESLAYKPSNGYVTADKFLNLPTHLFPLNYARLEMNVFGAFGLWTEQNNFVPLVYLAKADDDNEAKAIHKKVWSQGTVPFLLVVTPHKIWSCRGFTFSSIKWDQHANSVDWDIPCLQDISGQGVCFDDDAFPLARLHSTSLRSSLGWRDYALEVEGRVDTRLLKNLDSLCEVLTSGMQKLPKLNPKIANALIGRFLYLYFLFDRGIISQSWVEQRGHSLILDDPFCTWDTGSTWAFFDDLDSVFNGNIFPITETDRNNVKDIHISFLRNVIKHGGIPGKDGIQLSFLDFHFASIRTETLSAVYELFLQHQNKEEKAGFGAFYTPPFLADYVLDRVEETLPLREGITILDCTAGSGVFLVGAYRRMIEKLPDVWADSGHSLTLSKLKNLLVNNIFGIERNDNACHVAAFSLYLTMLDYVRPCDLEAITTGNTDETLFPSVVGSNILIRDYFDPAALPDKFPPKVDCIVGNPPWCKILDLKSKHILDYINNTKETPIGRDQSAEIFIWKSVYDHLIEGGVLGVLLPGKSFINETSEKFISKLAKDVSILGIANFAHFRKCLFRNAKHAAAAIFLKKVAPEQDNRFWVYNPLLVGQPTNTHDRLWAIIVDRSDVKYHGQNYMVQQQKSGWSDAFILTPVDRRLIRYIESMHETGKTITLRDLEERLGLVWKQGDSERRSGISPQFQLSADKKHANYFKAHLKIGEFATTFFETSSKIVPLPKEALNKAKKGIKRAFSGRIVLVPRTADEAFYIEPPVAFGSAFNCITFRTDSQQMTEPQVSFLKALSLYLNTKLIRYLTALFSPSVLSDRPRVCLEDFKSLPSLFNDLEDPDIPLFLSRTEAEREEYVFSRFGLTGAYRKVIEEFVEERIFFKDGGIPNDAINVPDENQTIAYSLALQQRLNKLSEIDSYRVKVYRDIKRSLGAVETQFIDPNTVGMPHKYQAVEEAIFQEYDRRGGNIFTNSCFVWNDRDNARVFLVKPLERYHWSVERAFSDSEVIDYSIMSSALTHWT